MTVSSHCPARVLSLVLLKRKLCLPRRVTGPGVREASFFPFITVFFSTYPLFFLDNSLNLYFSISRFALLSLYSQLRRETGKLRFPLTSLRTTTTDTPLFHPFPLPLLPICSHSPFPAYNFLFALESPHTLESLSLS